MSPTTRRRYLGVLGTATVLGLAGCSGAGQEGDGTATGTRTSTAMASASPTATQSGGERVPGSDYPAIDEWLTTDTVGAPDDTYDGTLLDATGLDELTIEVGAPGNGGAFAYAPVAVVISAGTLVEWSWTGEGSPHNVEAEPEEQLDESDYEFSSGDAVAGEGVQFTYTFDTPGVALYHCEPHLALGMKGGIAVE